MQQDKSRLLKQIEQTKERVNKRKAVTLYRINNIMFRLDPNEKPVVDKTRK
ncbi:hypothetical protein SAMN05660236_1361 [Ohtaekwangia koreensis]|uniref:Uncharacterized protein n=1 Tax=Ohtaekwangia koreensis TaxID=688867 RepID=A0A1T5JQG0_9BACT|nr:hypothetical protein SAMN05660236_1361 [Ohtaekwangia koreensis]